MTTPKLNRPRGRMLRQRRNVAQSALGKRNIIRGKSPAAAEELRRKVILYVAQGITTKAIAKALNLSTRQVLKIRNDAIEAARAARIRAERRAREASPTQAPPAPSGGPSGAP